MATFVPHQPVVTTTPQVDVTVTAAARLAPGKHRFQLTVVDDTGLVSDPTVVDVMVVDGGKPTAILDAPTTVPVGTTFTLSGARSFDSPPGRIVQYRWELIG